MSGSVGCGSPGGSFPTPAGVLAKVWANNTFGFGFKRIALKSIPALTSASTGDADAVSAFRVACFEMFTVYSIIIPAPVMRRIVKARQARKNVEV